MPIKLIILNKDSKEYTFQKSNTILDVKNMILNDFYDGKGYIDINLLLERPKRTFGKFNLEPGVLSRSFDSCLLDDFGLNNDVINIKIEYFDKNVQQCKTKDTKKGPKKVGNTSGKYIPPHKKKNSDQNKSFTFDEKDFPALG